MNIIIASEVIHPGGAETFILRLAQALHEKGHKVKVFVFYKHLLNKKLCTIFAPDVKIVSADIPYHSLLSKIDGALFRLRKDFSLRDYYIRKSLAKLIKTHKAHVIHGHLLKVDKICLDVARPKKLPVVNTIHGDYIQFYEKTKKQTPIPLLNYYRKAKRNLRKVNQVVCISDKQVDFFKSNFAYETTNKISKIYNGYRATVNEDANALRKKLNIKDGDFVFGMVSRGIPEKGWQIAIDAFLKLANENAHLILTGKSDYLTALADKYGGNGKIHFTGHADNPINWINVFDVGLLPTTYPSESLPTVIIEYLYCGIPVVASDAGEINNMTGQPANPASIIVPIEGGKVDTNTVAMSMQKYMEYKELYNAHAANAKKCYEMFDMEKCVEAYIEVYKKAKNNSKQHIQ